MQVHKAAHDFLGGFFHKPDGLAVDPGDPEQPVQRQPDRGHEQDDGDPAEGRPRVPLVQQGMAGAVDGEPVHDGHEAQKDHRVRDEDQARNGQQREQERDVEHRRVGEKGLSWNLQPRTLLRICCGRGDAAGLPALHRTPTEKLLPRGFSGRGSREGKGLSGWGGRSLLEKGSPPQPVRPVAYRKLFTVRRARGRWRG